MEKSQDINALAAALSKAQAELKAAIKANLNPFFKSKYADLSQAWDACRDALTKNGLSVVQIPEHRTHGWVLLTSLMHSSGQFMVGEYPILAAKQDAQSMGSAVTYARRYSLMAMVGIATEDDDGEVATGRNGGTVQQKVVHKPPPPPINVSEAPSYPERALQEEVNPTPTHCGKPMMVSKYDKNLLYCVTCKSKVAK